MVKTYVRKCTNRKHFSLDQLITLLAEIEAILNSKPLTFVYKDIESGFTLTPVHFLVTNQKLGLHNTGDIDYLFYSILFYSILFYSINALQ